MLIAIAVPISWPTTMSPTVACWPSPLTLSIDVDSCDVSTSTTILPCWSRSSHLSADVLERRRAPAELLGDADGRALQALGDLVRVERLEQRHARLLDRRGGEVHGRRQGPGRLLGLDRRLDREGEAAVEAEAVVEHGAHERGQRAADRVGLAVDEVLAGEAVDVGPEPGLVELGVGLPSAMSPSAMPGMSTSLTA